jgi:hypothetical protein
MVKDALEEAFVVRREGGECWRLKTAETISIVAMNKFPTCQRAKTVGGMIDGQRKERI